MALILFCSWQFVLAQKTITGTVTDAKDGSTIPGVNVVVKGTPTGTNTDVSGKFSIKATAEQTLLFSFVGYKDQEIKVGNQSVINVVLQPTLEELKEVVVTALGLKREQRSLGYAVSTIKGADMIRAGNSNNPLTSLYGKAAGVGIAMGTAGPTGGVNIKIRGAASLGSSMNSRPLFVVDGIPIYDQNSSIANRGYDPLNSFDYGSGINDINSEDIESIDILKGAKASVLYGGAGANGVVLITTKSGRQTRGLGVELSYQHTWDKPVNFMKWQNEYGSGASIYDTVYATLPNGTKVRKMNNSRFNFGPKFDNQPIMFYDKSMISYSPQPTNYDDLFNDTQSDALTLAISGANDKGSMRVAYTNKNYNGFFPNFNQKDNTISFNGQIKASEFADFEVVANLYDVKTQNRYPNIGRLTSYGYNRDIPYAKLLDFYKDEQGYKRNLDDYGFPASISDGTGLMNMMWNAKENRNIDERKHFTAAFKTNLHFTDYLFLAASAGLDYTDWDFTTMNQVERNTATSPGGKYAFRRDNHMKANYRALLNFNKKYFNDKLDVLAFAGAEYLRNSDNSVSASSTGGLQNPGWYSINASVSQTGSFYLRGGTNRGSDVTYRALSNVSLSWEDTYYLELSAANDWTSTLPLSNNSYFYPGVSFSWNFNETYQIPKLTYGKLRLAYANVGRGASRYFSNVPYGVGYITNTTVPTVSGPGSLVAGELQPEKKKEYEIGLNTRWFEKSRLEFDFSFYNNNVYNQLMSVNLSATGGWSNININAGDVRNWGYEFFIKGAPLVGENYRWDVTLTTANQRSKVIKLYPGITEQSLYGSNSYAVKAIEGRATGDIQMFDYLKDPQGNRIVSANGLYSPDKKKLVNAANINPKFLGGVQTEFSYKHFNVYAGIDYKFGGTFLSMTNYYMLGMGQSEESLKYRDEANGGMAYYIDANNKRIPWEHNKPAPAGAKNNRVYHDGLILDGVKESGTAFVKNDQILSAYEYYSGSYIQDMGEWFQPDYLYKNDYIKLREVSVRYTLPKKFSNSFKLQKVAFSVFARNLAYLYKTMPNVDAEASLGTDEFQEYSSLPATRSFGFKVDVSF